MSPEEADTTDGPVVLEIPPADEGSITGSIDDAWQAALADVGPAGIDAVAVWKLDRLGRNTLHILSRAARRPRPGQRAVSSIVLNWCGRAYGGAAGAGGAEFVAIQPTRHAVDNCVGILELGCMSDVMKNHGVPLGIRSRRRARGGDGHEPIPVAVDEQNRLRERADDVLEATRPECGPHK
jgi:hypothetical protein